MRKLRMYDGLPVAPVDHGGMDPDRNCTRCAWSAGAGRACLPADGAAGGLLVVGDTPVKGATRPFASATGAFIRGLVAEFWKGPVVYDYAVKCPGGGAKTKDAAKPIRECRPFLAEVVRQAQPERVLAIGGWAVTSLLGRSLDMDSTRHGYGWVLGDVPVFMAHAPSSVMHNKFLKARYRADVQWALTAPRPRPGHVNGIVHVIENEADALLAELALEDQPELLFDVETAGVPHSDDFTVLCAGVCAVDELEGDAWVWSDKALIDPRAKAILKRLLEERAVSGSNIKYDTIAARECLSIAITKIGFDTQLVRKLMEPTSKGRLEYAAELVGMGGAKEEAGELRKKAVLAARRKVWRPGEAPHDHWCVKAIRNGAETGKYSFGLLPEDVLWRYNGRDVATSAAATIHLRRVAETEHQGELKCWDSLYKRAVVSFDRIERTGMYADRQGFEAFSAFLNVGLRDLRQKFKAYGEDFNPNSQPQVAKLLFERLGLPKGEVSEKTGAASTAKDTLSRLAGLHPVVDQIIEWRRLEKLDGTYAAGMLPHILDDGCIHPTFRLDGTESGRISSENPNGQNIPRPETVEGKMARDGFTARPGRVMISLDQSQIELRVAAGMSGDEGMIQIFKSGIDYHMRTAQLIAKVAWGIAEEMVSKLHRSYAKTVNFGLLYGKTDAGLAQQLGCTIDEARRVRLSILGRFKKLAKMIEKLLYHARKFGSIDVPWFDGAVHTRPLYEVGGQDKWKRQNAENSSVNTPIQGRAAWYTLAAIPLIHDWIDESGVSAEIVNTVHDSIMLDADPSEVDTVIENCSRIMTSFDCWGVPLVVDADAGLSWGSLRSLEQGEKYADAQVRWVAEALKASTI